MIHPKFPFSSYQQRTVHLFSRSMAEASSPTPLRIFNSLTREKDTFTPIEKGHVKWYACGPTVYDDSHLGHARNYVSTDVIRRILRDHFKNDVKFQLNITDIDDKIVLKAQRAYFLKEYKDAHPQIDPEVLDTTQRAFDWYFDKNLKKHVLGVEVTPQNAREILENKFHISLPKASALQNGTIPATSQPDNTPAPPKPPADMSSDDFAKIIMHSKTMVAAADALNRATSLAGDADAFYSGADDVLFQYLPTQGDLSKFAHDHRPFKAVTTLYEDRFFDDMDALNVLRPDVLTRVTDYVPQIVKFVEIIEDKGFAYATDEDGARSVYFDIAAFEKAGNKYARLEPWNRNDTKLLAEGEGALSENLSGKRSAADFAIWKASKMGEPTWSSERWGNGRPGWHIECSVMASDILGSQLDIHSGGIDLAFPHHDNEIAQSEAYFYDKSAGKQHQWVNYFLHMGHLSIQGAKMSKSLKNFTTIREALGRGDWTPRGFRTVILLGAWRDGIEITPELVKDGQAWEAKVTNFFVKALDLTRNPSSNPSSASTTSLDAAKRDFDAALRDSFDTPRAMKIISAHITDLNAQLNSLSDDKTLLSARWITGIVRMLGLTNQPDAIGWEGVDIPESSKPWVFALSRLRDNIRRQARAKPFEPTSISLEDIPNDASDSQSEAFKQALQRSRTEAEYLTKNASPAKDFLTLADKIRDDYLWRLGVYLEDPLESSRPAIVRPLTDELRAERDEKEAREATKASEKMKKLQLEEEKKKAEMEKARVRPQDLYRNDEWSEWDADGIPVKDKDGNEVTKSKMKGLKKGWEVQKKLWERYNGSK